MEPIQVQIVISFKDGDSLVGFKQFTDKMLCNNEHLRIRDDLVSKNFVSLGLFKNWNEKTDRHLKNWATFLIAADCVKAISFMELP